jgi:AraC-like DNA-binding protein
MAIQGERAMSLIFQERLSDSPLVERVWQSYSEGDGTFLSVAVCHWEMVVTKYQGSMMFTIRGPETLATQADYPKDGEWVGIRFKLGTFMPKFPANQLVGDETNLPEAGQQSFWLDGAAWEFPTYENADTFVSRLVKAQLIVDEPLVDVALQDRLPNFSLRTVQRRFLQATGLTQGATRQIERARHATTLLRQGTSILDTVYQAGYADQPHLTRSLKHYIGQTPSQIADEEYRQQLSFLFNTK